VPVAVVGSGVTGGATLIDAILDEWYHTPDEELPIRVVMLDSRDHPSPPGDTPYPLDGHDARDLDPFPGNTPLEGFPTFGQFVDAMADQTPILRSALPAPTYGQVNEYLVYLLKLMLVASEDGIQVQFVDTPIDSIQEPVRGGPATITLSDGKSIAVRRIVRGVRPPFMGGPPFAEPAEHADGAGSEASQPPA